MLILCWITRLLTRCRLSYARSVPPRLTCIPSLTSGYSRFPVHETGKPLSFIGSLLIKTVRSILLRCVFHLTSIYPQLLVYDPSRKLPVSSFALSILPEADPTITCFHALDYLYVASSRYIFIRALMMNN